GGSFAGTVTFNCGGSATITVTATKTINADTTIDGGGVITISGGGTVGVFLVIAPANIAVTFTVKNLTVADGRNTYGGLGGGGILNEGALGQGGTVIAANSTFLGNSAGRMGNVGGAIENYNGTLTVTDSTFAGNNGSEGGADV